MKTLIDRIKIHNPMLHKERTTVTVSNRESLHEDIEHDLFNFDLELGDVVTAYTTAPVPANISIIERGDETIVLAQTSRDKQKIFTRLDRDLGIAATEDGLKLDLLTGEPVSTRYRHTSGEEQDTLPEDFEAWSLVGASAVELQNMYTPERWPFVINAILLATGWSQEKLCEELGIAKNAVRRWLGTSRGTSSGRRISTGNWNQLKNLWKQHYEK